MDGLEIQELTVGTLPDLVAPCMIAGTLGSHLTLPTDLADDMSRGKLAYHHERRVAGAAACVARLNGRAVGVLEYYPIEVAPVPVLGRDLFVIHCLQVPGRDHREEIERELVGAAVTRWSSRKGVVVLGREKPWDKLGFEEVSRDEWPEGGELILWQMKFWEVEEPRLTPVRRNFHLFRGKVMVHIFESSSCPWTIYLTRLVEEVAAEIGSGVIVDKIDCNDRKNVLEHGVTGGVALNGKFQRWLRPHPAPTRSTIRAAIEDLL